MITVDGEPSRVADGGRISRWQSPGTRSRMRCAMACRIVDLGFRTCQRCGGENQSSEKGCANIHTIAPRTERLLSSADYSGGAINITGTTRRTSIYRMTDNQVGH